MRMIAAIAAVVVLACIVYGLSRGAVSGHEVVHDTPALIAYLVAVVAANVGGFALARAMRRG